MELDEIMEVIRGYVAETIGEVPEEIDDEVSFFKLGISSIQALKIINRMRKMLEIDIDPVAMFEYKSVSSLAQYLYECVQEE